MQDARKQAVDNTAIKEEELEERMKDIRALAGKVLGQSCGCSRQIQLFGLPEE